jgi:ABC-type branched-subunit amino acid transport system substrate-binding protein
MAKREKKGAPKWISIGKLLIKFVGATVLAGIFSIVLGRIIDFGRGPETYSIYLLGNMDEEYVKDITDVFRKDIGEKLKIHGVKIEIREVDYQGNGSRAREISAQVAKAKDTLMVIGHFTSTQSEAALPNYLEKDPPIPVILTTETNPNLLPSKISEEDFCPVFRLSPTDDDQANNAADYASSKEDATVFWIVEDTSNIVYSKYLSSRFIEKVQAIERENIREKKVVLWSTNLTVPSVETFNALKINCVFFAGRWSNALILIRQIKALSSPGQMPTVILSDWAADKRLIDQGRDDVEGVYLTHPLSADQYQNNGYKLYGQDAAKIIEELVKKANEEFSSKINERNRLSNWIKWLFNIHSVKDARYVLNSVMKDAVLKRYKFDGTLEDEKYSFGPYGTREGAKFHIWQIKNGTFVEVLF